MKFHVILNDGEHPDHVVGIVEAFGPIDAQVIAEKQFENLVRDEGGYNGNQLEVRPIYPQGTPQTATEAIKLFNDLAREISYGFNMRMEIMNMADAELAPIRNLIEVCRRKRDVALPF